MLKPLILRSTSLRKLKVNALARQPLVNLAVGVETIVDPAPLLLVQDDLEDLRLVLPLTQPLADNLDRVDEVVQDGVVHRGQGAAARTLLLLAGARSVRTLRSREDAARGDDQHVAV